MYGFWDSSATRARPEADRDLNGMAEDIVDIDPFAVNGLRDSLPTTKSLELIVQRYERIEPSATCFPVSLRVFDCRFTSHAKYML